jgi:uncharacterized membrane protein
MSSPDRNSPATENIEAVVRLEEEEERRSTLLDRISHGVGSFVGSVSFVSLQLTFILMWVVGHSTSLTTFDPFPYPLLSLILSAQAVVLSSFVLIKQNRTETIANRRNHLDLQINLLAEKEITKVLRLIHALNQHLNVPGHELEKDAKLLEETAVDDLAEQLKEKENDPAD